MSTFILIVLFTAGGGAVSAALAGVFLLLPEASRHRLMPHLVSFATGALLGAALAALLPHAMESAGPENMHKVGLALLGGILAFFVLEKFVLWRHCHEDPCEAHAPQDHHRDRASAIMILWGDGFHNALDGVLIAAAFMTDVHLGIVSAIAVFAHEVPQELGDLAILMHGGYSRMQAMVMNVLVSLTSVIGAVIAYFALSTAMQLLPYAIAVAAASFIYIAVADLIPGLHRRADARTSAEQVLFILLVMAVIYVTHRLAH